MSLADRLRAAIGPSPDWVIVFYTDSIAPEFAQQAVTTAFPNAAVHGCSSSTAMFGGDGIMEDPSIGVLAITDPGGAFGTGITSFARLAPADAARRAVEQAIAATGKNGAVPDFIWLSAVPGCEEAIIAGIEQSVGASVPIVGGSAATLNDSGNDPKAFKWAGHCVVFTRDAVIDDGLLLSVGFVTGRVYHGFFGGYRATEQTGIVTATQGRVLLTIDEQPAAQVYNRWSEGLIASEVLRNGDVVTQTTMSPIGVTVGHVGTAPLHGLVHPVRVENGALRVQAVVPEGSRLTLMTGDQDILVKRTAELVARTRALFNVSTPRAIGGLISYCAACMGPLAERGVEMIDLIRDALGGAPFMGGFFFGEQGRFWDNRNAHANLMVSLLLFEDFHAPSPAGNKLEFSPPAFQNDLALGYQIVKAQLDEMHRINALLRVGLAKLTQARSRAEVYKAVGDSLTEVIDFDGFAVLRRIEENMVCTASSAQQLIGTVWRDEEHGALYATQKPTLLGDAHKSRIWRDNAPFFQALRPGSAIHLGFHAENAPVHIVLTHHTVNGFDLADRDILYIMNPYIRQAFENVAHLRQMEKLATIDSLTGISNRGHFLELAALELARSKRFGHSTGVLMIDADHFKQINDRYGHNAGDAALRQLAAKVRGELREVDLLGRLGGEEFAVLVVEADRAKAVQVGERIRAAIESAPIVRYGYSFRMTVSIGVAASPTSTVGIETLLTEADRALYAAKSAGRNRVLGGNDAPDASDRPI